jgi:hypothetical protein
MPKAFISRDAESRLSAGDPTPERATRQGANTLRGVKNSRELIKKLQGQPSAVRI